MIVNNKEKEVLILTSTVLDGLYCDHVIKM